VGESFVVGDSFVDLENEVGEGGWGEVDFLVVGDFAEVANVRLGVSGTL